MKKILIVSFLCISFLSALFVSTKTMANDTFLRGDANGDGKVFTADAAYILQCVVGLKLFNNKWIKNADVDNDGELTAEDAAMILRHIVKLIDLSDPIWDATPVPTQKPTQTPSSTPKPTKIPKPTKTPNPTEAPETYTCRYCGKSFGTNFSDFYYHAYIDPGCYNYGYAVTPSPSPTPTPSHPAGNGHWEEVWVVDIPRQGHTVWVCNVCGHRSYSEAECSAHDKAHALNEGLSGWHVETIVDVPEQGHWETIWVEDP